MNVFGWFGFRNAAIAVQPFLKSEVANKPQICTLGGIARGQKPSESPTSAISIFAAYRAPGADFFGVFVS
jgi:hypothetical protein